MCNSGHIPPRTGTEWVIGMVVAKVVEDHHPIGPNVLFSPALNIPMSEHCRLKKVKTRSIKTCWKTFIYPMCKSIDMAIVNPIHVSVLSEAKDWGIATQSQVEVRQTFEVRQTCQALPLANDLRGTTNLSLDLECLRTVYPPEN